MTLDATLVLLACSGIAALGAGFVLGWRRRGAQVAALANECARLGAAPEEKARALAVAVEQAGRVAEDFAVLQASAARSGPQLEQLRDLVKVHVARRREFDEWANPIRESLGEGIGQVMRKLKDQLARQEFSMKRQERIVAEAQDQYRGKRDELEHMRRELTLKNYHIAALNERFIRIEERMQDLTAQVAGMGNAPGAGGAIASVAERMSPEGGEASERAQSSPETERFSMEADGTKDWMSMLDDWHRQLHQRFDRLEALQARLRGQPARGEPGPPHAQPARLDGGSAA